MIVEAAYDDLARQTYLDLTDEFLRSIPMSRLVGQIGIRGAAMCSSPKNLQDIVEPEKIDVRTTDLEQVRGLLERMQPVAHMIGFNIGGFELGKYERPVVKVYGSESRTPIRSIFGKGSFQHTLSVQRSYYEIDPTTLNRIDSSIDSPEEDEAIRIVYFVSSREASSSQAQVA